MGPIHSKFPEQFSDAKSTSATVPSKSSAFSAATPPHKLAPSHDPAVRILLAEDDPDIRHLTRSILVAQGYTVFSCADGRHALEIVHAAPRFDLLITDIQMPHLSGLDLAAHLCAAHPATPIILMSGNPPSQSTLVHFAQRGWHFFLKPVPILTLLDTIEHSLATRDIAKPSHPSHPLPTTPTLHPKHGRWPTSDRY